MQRGDWVEATAYGGEYLRRRVVAVENGKVYICTDDEFHAAERERREPMAVGFDPRDVQEIRASA